MLGQVTCKNRNEIGNLAAWFIEDVRLKSLEYDVNRCLRKTKKSGAHSPFPALLNCLSTIDLLGSLFKGDTTLCASTKNAKNYISTFMGYGPDETELLWKYLIRHKLVHLAMPQTAVKYNAKMTNYKDKTISWNLHEQDISKHLTIIWNKENIIIGKNSNGKIKIDGKFVLNIKKLKEDIINSIRKTPDGYLARLKRDNSIQDKFMTAINEIYNV
jgi:hypothetical protein